MFHIQKSKSKWATFHELKLVSSTIASLQVTSGDKNTLRLLYQQLEKFIKIDISLTEFLKNIRTFDTNPPIAQNAIRILQWRSLPFFYKKGNTIFIRIK